MSEHKQIRHLGIYRTGITPEQAAIDNKNSIPLFLD